MTFSSALHIYCFIPSTAAFSKFTFTSDKIVPEMCSLRSARDILGSYNLFASSPSSSKSAKDSSYLNISPSLPNIFYYFFSFKEAIESLSIESETIKESLPPKSFLLPRYPSGIPLPKMEKRRSNFSIVDPFVKIAMKLINLR